MDWKIKISIISTWHLLKETIGTDKKTRGCTFLKPRGESAGAGGSQVRPGGQVPCAPPPGETRGGRIRTRPRRLQSKENDQGPRRVSAGARSKRPAYHGDVTVLESEPSE